jgi:hypothetical protein
MVDGARQTSKQRFSDYLASHPVEQRLNRLARWLRWPLVGAAGAWAYFVIDVHPFWGTSAIFGGVFGCLAPTFLLEMAVIYRWYAFMRDEQRRAL